jgi:hypothetical protein
MGAGSDGGGDGLGGMGWFSGMDFGLRGWGECIADVEGGRSTLRLRSGAPGSVGRTV